MSCRAPQLVKPPWLPVGCSARHIQSARERSELDSKHREQLEAVQARAASLDAEARALREQKYGLDARASELSHKLGAAEGSNR